MLSIVVPKDKKKLQKQMAALKWQIEHDTNDKDRNIHKEALKQLEAALNSLEG